MKFMLDVLRILLALLRGSPLKRAMAKVIGYDLKSPERVDALRESMSKRDKKMGRIPEPTWAELLTALNQLPGAGLYEPGVVLTLMVSLALVGMRQATVAGEPRFQLLIYAALFLVPLAGTVSRPTVLSPAQRWSASIAGSCLMTFGITSAVVVLRDTGSVWSISAMIGHGVAGLGLLVVIVAVRGSTGLGTRKAAWIPWSAIAGGSLANLLRTDQVGNLLICGLAVSMLVTSFLDGA